MDVGTPTKKRWIYLARLVMPLVLGCLLWFIGWGTVIWFVNAEEPLNCLSQPVLSKGDGPTYLISPGQPLVYTLTNQSSCTDTYSIEVTTLSDKLIVEYWDPVTVALKSNQNSAIRVHMPVIADVGTITDTLLITASSQTMDNVESILEDTVIMPGSVFPGLQQFIYFPLVVRKG
ncbi:MAG: hypothetical protein KDJ52_17645 [Anaerolineae bacterium]|nr:hypothetical protein [Anaerolineae bacterium]